MIINVSELSEFLFRLILKYLYISNFLIFQAQLTFIFDMVINFLNQQYFYTNTFTISSTPSPYNLGKRENKIRTKILSKPLVKFLKFEHLKNHLS